MVNQGRDFKNDVEDSKLPGPDFVAPDGGWGWMVVIASGLSTLSVLPVLQVFGLIFRDRFEQLGMSNSEMTTIINVNVALASCVGLANGPMFRKFNYRPVAIFGSILVICGLLLVSIANNFITYLFSISIMYGLGTGICASANALALNTYFNKRRRHAVSLSWTVAALGPIVTPYLVTFLLPNFGVQGTVLLAAGLSMHALVAGLTLQPAQRHSKAKTEPLTESGRFYTNSCNTPLASRASRSIFSSQYFLNEVPGCDIIETFTPMLSRANDGWYSSEKRSLTSSKLSLTSKKYYINDIDFNKTSNQNLSKKASFSNLTESKSKKTSVTNLNEMRSRKSSLSTKVTEPKSSLSLPSEQKPRKQKRQSVTIKIEESEIEDCPSNKAPQDLHENEKTTLLQMGKNVSPYSPPENQLRSIDKINDNSNLNDNNSENIGGLKSNKPFNIENDILIEASKKLEIYAANFNKNKKPLLENKDHLNKNDEEQNHTLWQKINIFFDLDLLNDFTYVNLMIGINLANFAEINFSILTPFILADYGLKDQQIALVMSLLAGMDILVRFLIPFVTKYIEWENKSFFLFGILGMALGRLVIIYFPSYPVIVCACAWIGLNKALRTVFMALVIASYVPLQRLPAATGIQLLFAGLLYPTLGPIVGWIRDSTDYTTTLHCLNILTYITAISWICESIYRKYATKSAS